MSRFFLIMTVLLATGTFTRAVAADRKDEPKQVVIISQAPDGHPWNTHEFRAGARILKQILNQHPAVNAVIVDADTSPRRIPEAIDQADAVVLLVSEGARWVGTDAERRDALKRLAARGGGIASLHWAVGTRDARYIEIGKQLWGGVHGGPDRQYTVSRATMIPNPEHPITRGLEPLTIRDEWYHHLKFAREGTVTPLWTVEIKGEPQTVSWAWERKNGGRSFGFVGLHYHQNWAEETYRDFVSWGVLWTLGIEREPGVLSLDFARQDLETPRPK